MDQTESYGADSKFTGLKIAPEKLTIVGIDCPDSDCPDLADPDSIATPVDKELAESMAAHGNKTPIEVKRYRGDSRTFVVVGRTRVRAARYANEKLADDVKILMKCLPSDGDPFTSLVLENEHHRVISPIERARKAQRARDRGASESTLRNMFKVGQQTLDQWKDMLAAPTEALKAVASGEMSATVAAEIGKTAPAKQKAALEVAKKTKGKDAAEQVRRVRLGKEPDEAGRKALTKGRLRKLEESLRPTKEEPHGEDDGNLSLAWRLLRVVLGAAGPGVLSDFPDVAKLVRKVVKDPKGGAK